MGDTGDRYVIRIAGETLRPVSLGDLEELHRLWVHPDMRRFFWDDEVIPYERAEAAVREAIHGFERYGFGLWVDEGDDGAILGFCGLRHLDEEPAVEVLYGVSPHRWGRGMATGMAAAMLRYGFERTGLPLILGIADADNTASRRVLEKVGMTFERYVFQEGRKEARYSMRPDDVQPTNET